METLVEVIFKGEFSLMDFTFLKEVIEKAREVRFNDPEIFSIETFDEVIKILCSNEYVDLVINTDRLEINSEIIPKVFINFGRNNEEIELLLFFDLNDLSGNNIKGKIDNLKNWTIKLANNYNFNYYICQMDNADEDEYYFDSNGVGKLYTKIVQNGSSPPVSRRV